MIARGNRFPGSDNPIALIAIVLLVFYFLTNSFVSPVAAIIRNPTSPDAWIGFIGFVVAVFLGIAVHEFMHAWTAHGQGDDTAKHLGRMTLNPFAHFDLFGSLLILVAGFGYGKPVPFNEARLRGGAIGVSAIALAGPLANFALATLCALPLRFGGALPREYAVILLSIVLINVRLGVFNLIPIPPLDGSNVVFGLLPPAWRQTWRAYQQYGPMVLLVLFLAASQVLFTLIEVPSDLILSLVLGDRF